MSLAFYSLNSVESCIVHLLKVLIYSARPHYREIMLTSLWKFVLHFSDLTSFQSVFEEIKLQPSKVSLLYFSHRAPGVGHYINLTLAEHPDLHRIHLIHVQVEISGVRWSKVTEPEPHLSIAFEWDKKNAYGKPVYGKARAKGSIVKSTIIVSLHVIWYI